MIADLSLAEKVIVSDVSHLGDSWLDARHFENDESTSAVSTTFVLRGAASDVPETWDRPFYSAYATEMRNQLVLAIFPEATGWIPGVRSASDPLPHGIIENESRSAIPNALWANWEGLRRSNLSEEAFETIYAAATDRRTDLPTDPSTVNAVSLENFLDFWDHISVGSAEPEVSVNPKGLIHAEWYADDSNFLIIEFRDDRKLFFSLWDSNLPVEGIQDETRMYELAAMLKVRYVNPFLWGADDP